MNWSLGGLNLVFFLKYAQVNLTCQSSESDLSLYASSDYGVLAF